MLRYSPEYAAALVSAAQLRREYAELTERLARQCGAIEVAIDPLRSLHQELVRALAQLEATKDWFAVQTAQTGKETPTATLELLHHQEEELRRKIQDSRAQLDAHNEVLMRFRYHEACARLLVEFTALR